MKQRYDSTKDLEVEARRRAKISESMKGNKNGVGKSNNNKHRLGCSCGWCSGSPIGMWAGANNPSWKGGVSGIGYGPGWKSARRAVWERDKVCRACGLPPYTDRCLDVHHIIERRDGGGNELDNLVGLHHGCHTKVHARKLAILGMV